MNNTIFILNTVSPIFLIMVLGWILRKRGIIAESFIKQITKFVFNVTLPVLIFLKLATVDFRQVFDVNIIILIYLGIFIIFSISWLIARQFIPKGHGRGVFIQGSFRPNNVIIGLALIMNIFGDEGIARTVVILTFLVPLDNVLSVVALTIFDETGHRGKALLKSLRSIITNPVIIAGIVAIIYSILKLPLPIIIATPGKYLADITLPLALIGVGASLRVAFLKKTSLITMGAALLKLIIAPVIGTGLGYLWGYVGMDLGIIFIIFACPTAIVSYILAEAMTPHGEIAGNIVITTTLLSALTLSLGLMLLSYLGVL